MTMQDDLEQLTEWTSDQDGYVDPVTWPFAADAWRLASRFSTRDIDRILRLRSARSLPLGFRARFNAMQIPNDTTLQTLGEIRSLRDWLPAWNIVAQRYLGEARREELIGNWQEAAIARRNAAMCYHAASFFTAGDIRAARTVRSSAAKAFAQAVHHLYPETRRIGVVWRSHALPSYLAKPPGLRAPAPLVAILNGVTTSKEELLITAQPFIEHGFAVLCIDWPGTGESAGHRLSADCTDLTDAIVSLAEQDPDLDASRVSLVGLSLGGALAIRMAAQDPRVTATVAITPPYDPAPWSSHVNVIVRQQVAEVVGDDPEALTAFALTADLPRLAAPLLVFGAGRDLSVPPKEAIQIASLAATKATLAWYPAGGHGLYEVVDDWTAIAAEWLIDIAFVDDSTRVESAV